MTDWILNTFEQWGPLVLAPLLAGVALALSLVLRALLRRVTWLQPLRETRLVVIASLLFLMLTLAWTALTPSLPAVPFDSHVWREKSWRRSSMVEDVVGERLRVGMGVKEVRALLGEGDGSYDFADSWYLWRPRDGMRFFPPELVVKYDERDRVRECFIEPGGF